LVTVTRSIALSCKRGGVTEKMPWLANTRTIRPRSRAAHR
jgi:hypothetical protein